MVQHTAFGKGMVLSVLKMGNDALLEIAFDDLGTKKLMAKTASSHMKRL
jgi:DNA helicase-2/ATP-dependent DNA helicase PcrA